MPGDVAEWFREYSDSLLSSYRSASRIVNRLTKGETREGQIYDLLGGLLPGRLALEQRVVVADSTGAQAQMFDLAMCDRLTWPLLFNEGGTKVAMVESVVALLEVKSRLDKQELDDILKKTASVGKLRSVPVPDKNSLPMVAAFAYTCDNLDLAYFDYAMAAHRTPEETPLAIAALGEGVLLLSDVAGRTIVAPARQSQGHRPILAAAGKDTLLVFFYILSLWASGRHAERAFQSYMPDVPAFWFDDDFYDAVESNANQDSVRKCFGGRGPIAQKYQAARKLLGLPIAP